MENTHKELIEEPHYHLLLIKSFFLKSRVISADYSIKDRALASGAKDFLEKPFKLDKLSQIIEKIITEN